MTAVASLTSDRHLSSLPRGDHSQKQFFGESGEHGESEIQSLCRASSKNLYPAGERNSEILLTLSTLSEH